MLYRNDFYNAVDSLQKQAFILPAVLGAVGNHPDDRSDFAAAGHGVLRNIGGTALGALGAVPLAGLSYYAAKRGADPRLTAGLMGGAAGSIAGGFTGSHVGAYDQNSPWWKSGLIGSGIGAGLAGLGTAGYAHKILPAQQRKPVSEYLKAMANNDRAGAEAIRQSLV